MSVSEWSQLGAVAAILAMGVYVFITQFFSYLTKRGAGTDASKGNVLSTDANAISSSILSELQRMNTNHLSHIQDAIVKGNERLIDAIHSDNTKMIEILGEIKGNLKK